MATINQHVSNIRALIKEHGRNPDVYTDGFLYSLLNGARNTLLEQNFNRKNFISEWDIKQYPVRLVKDKSHLIKCVTFGCDILRSEFKLPRALSTNVKSAINVTTFDYTPVLIVSENTYNYNKYDDIKKTFIQASIINDYLVIWNKLNLKSVLVSSIPEDILDWSKIPKCNEDGEYEIDTCFNALNEEFPISETYKDAMYSMVFNKLQIPLKLRTDNSNDSNNETR
jgi:hypothetical protein